MTVRATQLHFAPVMAILHVHYMQTSPYKLQILFCCWWGGCGRL